MDEDFCSLSSKLKLISSIDEHKKLYIGYNGVNVYDDNIFNSVWRLMSFNSRHKTLNFINETIDKALFFILMNKNSNRDIILNDLITSKKGISSLIETYDDDIMIVSKLRVINEKIDGFIKTNNISI